jgi:hypothetical protein
MSQKVLAPVLVEATTAAHGDDVRLGKTEVGVLVGNWYCPLAGSDLMWSRMLRLEAGLYERA